VELFYNPSQITTLIPVKNIPANPLNIKNKLRTFAVPKTARHIGGWKGLKTNNQKKEECLLFNN